MLRCTQATKLVRTAATRRAVRRAPSRAGSVGRSFSIAAVVSRRPSYAPAWHAVPQCSSLPNGRSYSSTTAAAGKEYPSHEVFSMPALSPTMETGTIAGWALGEGDSFSAGDVLCSVETDKATVDFEAQDDGVLAKILKQGDSAVDLKVGEPICIVVEEKDDVAAFADYHAASQSNQTTAPPVGTSSETASPPAPHTESPDTGDNVLVSSPSSPHPMMPSARFLAESKGLDATGLAGSGKGGRVTKADVLAAFNAGVPLPPLVKESSSSKTDAPQQAAAESVTATAPSVPPSATPTPLKIEDLANIPVDTHGGFEDVKNNNMRKVIAKRLTESKSQVPHFYTSVEIELDNVLKLRKYLVGKHDIKVSVNDLVIRCCALALRDVPEVNGTYDEKKNSVRLQDSVDVSVAVATPGGLITPIVPSTDKMGLSDINSKIKDLAVRAREGRLQPEEYQGGTFCVSNLGMFGINEFSAVINPPQAAILAVGTGTRTIVPTPYIEGTPVSEQPKPQIKTIMTARLSADRRVVDEATASLFLSAFQQYINDPDLLLL